VHLAGGLFGTDVCRGVFGEHLVDAEMGKFRVFFNAFLLTFADDVGECKLL
jgi:hypothetical protein